MNTSKLRLSYLFYGYYNKTATLQESDELFAIIAAGKKDKELSDLIRDAWNDLHFDAPPFNSTKSELILNNILASASAKKEAKPAKPVRNLLLWAKFSVAASGLLFLSIGVYNYLHKKLSISEKSSAKIKPLQHDALPGGNKAVLILANGKTIILDNAQNGTLAKQGNTIVNKTADGQLVYNLSNVADKDMVPSINTINTPRGGEYQVILPDGTKVWLNSASSLRFPTRFTGHSRDVEITGEAYFEVTKNKLMPFRVKTNRASIEVLGTHFNVMAYDDEKLMKTTLLEGSVNIQSGSATYNLTPGQQARINAAGKTKVTSDIDVDDEVAWKNGIFQFKDATIDVILRQASRWYDVNITYKGIVPPKALTGRLSRNVKASALLNMIKYTGIDLHIEGNNIIVE